MPVKLIHESTDVSDVNLLTTEGELTLEAQIVADFLAHADFSAVFDHPAAAPHISTRGEDGTITVGEQADADLANAALGDLAEDAEDGDEVQVMDAETALGMVDEDDLCVMLAHYVETLPESTLEDKARLAAAANLFGLDEFARGSFRKIRRRPGGGALVARMLGAMMSKGVISRAKGKGKGYKSGDYTRTANYKTGPKKANLQKVARYKKANQAKIKKSARMAKRAKKVKEGFEPAIFGLHAPVDGQVFEVSVREGVQGLAPRQESAKPAAANLSEGANLAGRIIGLGAKK